MQTRRMSPPRRSYRDAVLALAPTGYWQLAEPSGTVAHDEIRGNSATYVNTPTLGVSGPLVGDSTLAATFTGASSEAADTAAPVQTVVDNWSLVIWVNPSTSATNRCAFYNGNGSTGYGVYVRADHKLWAYAEGAGELMSSSGGAVISTTVWHHVALVRRAGTTFCYMDGALYLTGNTTSPNTPVGATTMGHEPAGNPFDGSLGHGAIFNRPLPFVDIYRLNRIGRGIS